MDLRILNCEVCGRTVLVADPEKQTVRCLEHSPEYWNKEALDLIPDKSGDVLEAKDESGTLFLAKYIPLDEYRDWLNYQPKPKWAKFYCIHHTWVPNPSQWYGYKTLIGVFNYYHNTLGWTKGKGPHLFIGQKEHGSKEHGIWIATHPSRQGIGAYDWNSDTIHAEHIWNGDLVPFNEPLMEAMRVACLDTCEWAGIPIQWPNRDKDGFANKSKSSILFHRDTRRADKSCPGNKMTHDFVMNYLKEEQELAKADEIYHLCALNRLSAIAQSYRDKILILEIRALRPDANTEEIDKEIAALYEEASKVLDKEQEQLNIVKLAEE